jgi:hypothetical protein
VIDLAAAVFEQRDALAAAQPRLRELRERVDRAVDMSPLDWSLFYALALSFKPDRIVELGRGFGNSTAAFTQAAHDLGSCEVVSVDRDRGHTWETQTLPKLHGAIDGSWLGHLDAIQADILDLTAERLFGDARRVVLLWDAHGDELGRYVLAALLPALQGREHLVILHDVTDTRWQPQDPAYGPPDAMTYWQGHLVCSFEEIYAAMDFITRNAIEPETPSHAFDTWLNEHKGAEANEMRSLFCDALGDAYLDNAYNGGGHWLYFDLDTRTSEAPLAFPRLPERGLHKRLVSRGLGLEKIDSASCMSSRSLYCFRTSTGLPSASMLPWSSRMARSQNSSTSDGPWLTKSSVTPVVCI